MSIVPSKYLLALEIIPRVTVLAKPCGVPTAYTTSPDFKSAEFPNSACENSRPRRRTSSISRRISARSVQWSQPTNSALTRSRFARVTTIFVA